MGWKKLTPPAESRIASTYPPPVSLPAVVSPLVLSYRVERLTPCCSSEYRSDQVSYSCRRGGNSSRISSAMAGLISRVIVVGE